MNPSKKFYRHMTLEDYHAIDEESFGEAYQNTDKVMDIAFEKGYERGHYVGAVEEHNRLLGIVYHLKHEPSCDEKNLPMLGSYACFRCDLMAKMEEEVKSE